MSEETDDFDDRADLATADQTIRRLKAEVERLRAENAGYLEDRQSVLTIKKRAEAAEAKLAEAQDELSKEHALRVGDAEGFGQEILELAAEVERLRAALEEIGKEADHGIPFYAYGDNEAGCEFSTRLSWISGRACAALRGEGEK